MSEDWPDYEEDPVGHCLAAFRHGDEHARFRAADILRGLAADAEAAIPALAEALRRDASDHVRAQCAFALADIGSAVGERASAAVPALIEALERDAFAEARALAAHALGEIGAAAEAAIPALERATRDGDEEVRESAQQALASLRG